MNLPTLESILILLLIAVFINVIFLRLNIPSIVGYIIVGILVGPHALTWIPDLQATRDIAEFGIVFLLFTIGLEFSLSRLVAMRRIVLGFGTLQVILSILSICFISLFFNLTPAEMFIVGCVVAMSSTAIVTKQLSEQLELNAQHGINAVGILLLQDLVVIPILIFIPSLAIIDLSSLAQDVLWALTKGFAAIVMILVIGRYLLRPVFYHIAARRSVELFTFTVLLITLCLAWLTHAFGLSYAFGAFLAGITLGETEFRHQIEADIRPFRDVLVALFFISIGMQMDWHIALSAWDWVLLLFLALTVFKIFLIYLLGLLFKNNHITSLRTGLALSQGGEFGFAILMLALNYKLIPIDYNQVILCAILLSMLISPLMIKYNGSIARYLLRGKEKNQEEKIKTQLIQATRNVQNHVIICGYGRVGQNTARILEKAHIPFVAFDLDAVRVAQAQFAGDKVFFADATHWEILQTAQLSRARAVVISLFNLAGSRKILQQIRLRNKHIPIIARSYDEAQAEELYELGATEVIPDTLESSLILGTHVLMLLKTPLYKVKNIISHIRHHRYDLLQWVFPSESEQILNEAEQLTVGLHVVILAEEAFAIGKKIRELALDKVQVKIIRVRRGKRVMVEPAPDTVLQAGDIVVIHGAISVLEKAEAYLFQGSAFSSSY